MRMYSWVKSLVQNRHRADPSRNRSRTNVSRWFWMEPDTAAASKATGAPAWVAWLPLPFNLGCLYLAFGQLLIARLEWEQVLYAVSDRTIYERRGFFRSQLRSLPLAAVTNVRQKRLGPNLATIRIDGEEGQTLHFSAIEHPELLLRLFPNVAAGHNSQKTT